MKILLDHQTFTRQEFGGISRYFFELLRNDRELKSNQLKLSLLFSNNAYLNQDITKYYSYFPGINFKGKVRLQLMLNERYSMKEIRKSNFDLLHPTYYDTYFLKHIKNKPFTVTYLDMIHEKFYNIFPELGYDKKLMVNKKILIDAAPKVIAISQATKNDLVEIYQVNPDKIEVIHLGSSFSAEMGLGPRVEARPYLLFVGSRNGYKNFRFCLESLRGYLQENDINFVCAGGGPLSAADNKLINELGLNKLVKHYEIKDSILANLYLHAAAFIFPSLYEGFGIPVLEAFSCNCPCLLSNGGSLPEVGGDAALYFDPSDEDSLLSVVEKVLNNISKRNELAVKGAARLKLFSWQNTYHQTLKFYQSLVK